MLKGEGKIKITEGRLHFTETNEPIGGFIIPDSQEWFLGKLIRQRSLPVLGTDFKPIGKRYLSWEVVVVNTSHFFPTKIEAELYIIAGAMK